MKKLILTGIVIKVIITVIGLFFIASQNAEAFVLPKANNPKTANLYWKTPITLEEAPILAKWDLLVLDMKAQADSQAAINKIRELNPDIIILAYTTANEIPVERLQIMEPSGAGLWHDLISGLDESWYLKTYTGEYITYWPGNRSMNQFTKNYRGESYNDYLINFYEQKVLSTNLWDGLLFDNIWNTVAWVNADIDIDGDGQKDDSQKIDRWWQESNKLFFAKIRNRLGGKYLIMGNGEGSYQDYLNGRMFESFPEFWEGGWIGSMQRYAQNNSNGYQPRINIINADSDNTGVYLNSSRMRYGLASALMYDGYYSFDYGTEKREQFWWLEEFDVNLGQAKTAPKNLLDLNNPTIKESIWQRDFEKGIAIVNSTNQKQTINFDQEYEKIKSRQNQDAGNIVKINKINLTPADGLLLLRPISEIDNAVFTNGSFARVFNINGENTRSGFFTYNSKFKGNVKIIKANINGGEREETVVADNSKIEIYSSYGLVFNTFYPYGEKFNSGLSLALADLNHDGQMEIITGPKNGASNEIKIFDQAGNLLKKWYAYKREWFNLGANVAAGDVNGDGEIEIITGAGFKGGPHVKIFDSNGNLLKEFFAYGFKFRGGVNVACGDLNGDSQAEIVTGAGLTGGPHLKIFDQNGQMIKEWFPYSPRGRDGVEVTIADTDDNGTNEVIALTANVFTLSQAQ